MWSKGCAGWLLGLLVLTGCATPASRIRRNPELFASFPPEVQANVREGRIDIGYSKDMVLMALGRPDRVYTRRTAEGVAEVWAYTEIRDASTFEPVEAGYWYRDRRGFLRRGHDLTFVNVRLRREYESLRVEFDGSAVRAIETVRTAK